LIETGVLILLAYIIGAVLGFLGGIESTLLVLQGSAKTRDILRILRRNREEGKAMEVSA
jgi:hypothetical protein